MKSFELIKVLRETRDTVELYESGTMPLILAKTRAKEKAIELIDLFCHVTRRNAEMYNRSASEFKALYDRLVEPKEEEEEEVKLEGDEEDEGRETTET